MHENGGVTGQEPNQLRTLLTTILQHQILVTSNITKPVALNILITLNKLTLINNDTYYSQNDNNTSMPQGNDTTIPISTRKVSDPTQHDVTIPPNKF